jgi:hypothetical protein
MHFEAMDVPERDFVVKTLPPTPLKLFQLFLPESLVQQWADYTNDPANAPANEGARQSHWIATSAAELWIWIGVWIYMISHMEYRLEDFWRAPGPNRYIPSHPIIKFITFDRFFLIKRRLCVFDRSSIHSGMPAPYCKVNDWANIIMEAAITAVNVGTFVAVDEGMVMFEGRSRHKLTIKTKPTDTGLKVWLLGALGYILQWIWHSPGAKFGPVGVEQQFWKNPDIDNEEEALNPTQGVVYALCHRLGAPGHHVFLDNLFSSPHLFRALRVLGHGATGTARTNCGLYKRLVDLKAKDRAGQQLWDWGRLESWPTDDGKVSTALKDIRDAFSSC